MRLVRMKCENCDKNHNGGFGSGRFCSKFCAYSFSTKNENKKETKKANCKICKKQLIVNKRSDINRIICENCQKEKELNNKNKIIEIRKCLVCGNDFGVKNVSKNTKSCSMICKNYLNSISRSKFLLKNGTSNFSTKQEIFSYKCAKEIRCDSKFEHACIIYLIDIFGVEKLEKFNSILNFWEDESHRTFNPDFYCKKNNKVFIVECKMKWSEKSNHEYNRTIPFKKIALQKFCENKKYEMIWLDFDYDKKLREIYRNYLKFGILNRENK